MNAKRFDPQLRPNSNKRCNRRWLIYLLAAIVTQLAIRSYLLVEIHGNDTGTAKCDKQHSEVRIVEINYPAPALATAAQPLPTTPSPLPPPPQQQREEPKQDIIAYSYSKGDRFGSSVLDMLGADALCFAMNYTYVGACRTPDLLEFHYEKQGKEITIERDVEKDVVLAKLGLSQWEHYGVSCPNPNTTENVVLLDEGTYRSNPFRLFTEEYLHHLRNKLVFTTAENSSNIFRIAVHLRRGDVNICSPGGWPFRYRYIPNAYYLTLLDQIIEGLGNSTVPYQVTIFTEPEEPDATEPFQPFLDRGYTIQTGGDEVEVWQAMIHADVFVMSQSFFSGLPAILNAHGRVYFPPKPLTRPKVHAMSPLPGWIEPTPELTKLTHDEIKRLEKECEAFAEK